jgi:hypothetical protein
LLPDVIFFKFKKNTYCPIKCDNHNTATISGTIYQAFGSIVIRCLSKNHPTTSTSLSLDKISFPCHNKLGKDNARSKLLTYLWGENAWFSSFENRGFFQINNGPESVGYSFKDDKGMIRCNLQKPAEISPFFEGYRTYKLIHNWDNIQILTQNQQSQNLRRKDRKDSSLWKVTLNPFQDWLKHPRRTRFLGYCFEPLPKGITNEQIERLRLVLLFFLKFFLTFHSQ